MYPSGEKMSPYGEKISPYGGKMSPKKSISIHMDTFWRNLMDTFVSDNSYMPWLMSKFIFSTKTYFHVPHFWCQYCWTFDITRIAFKLTLLKSSTKFWKKKQNFKNMFVFCKQTKLKLKSSKNILFEKL